MLSLLHAPRICGLNVLDRGLGLFGGYVETQHWNDELRFAAIICGWNVLDGGYAWLYSFNFKTPE